MTIGDVLAVVAGVLAVGATLWAAIIAFALLFADRTTQAAGLLEQKPASVLRTGTLVLIVAGVVGLILINQPIGLIKLVGWVMLAGLFALALLGSAGLARVVGERVRTGERRVGPFVGLCRGAGFVVAAGFLPLVGWFALFPVALVASLGASVIALRTNEATLPSPVVPAELAQ